MANLKLSFDARQYGSSAAKFYVGVMADVNDITTFQLLETFDLAASTEFTHCQMNLGDYELPYENLVLTAGIANVTPAKYDDWIDNVSLELLATCNPPRLTASGSSFYSVSMDIKPSKREDNRWQLVILPETEVALISNITAYLDTAAGVIVESTHVEFDNLLPATSYYIYARTLCEDDDISTWTRNPLKMNTLYYYHDSYFFGFENNTGKAPEAWTRSVNSESDNYYIHPALATGRDGMGAETQSFLYYPHSRQNIADSIGYSRT